MKNKIVLLCVVLIGFYLATPLVVFCPDQPIQPTQNEQIIQTLETTELETELIKSIISLTNHNFSYVSGLSEQELSKNISNISNRIKKLEALKSRAIKSTECYSYIELIQDTIIDLQEILNQYKNDLEIIKKEKAFWQAKSNEYPEATRVWLYMKNKFGWSDVVCAGVMGNIMAEISGGTLDFYDWNNDENAYGMFQWLGQRKIDIKQIYGELPTIEQQLEFMYDELYGTDGVTQQVTDSQREKILSASMPEDVATYFCIYFERPGNSGSVRRGYARIAYDYFVE